MGGWGGFASDMDEAREIVREAQKNRGSGSPGSVPGEGVSDLQDDRDHRWTSSEEQGIGGAGCPGESDPPVS